MAAATFAYVGLTPGASSTRRDFALAIRANRHQRRPRQMRWTHRHTAMRWLTSRPVRLGDHRLVLVDHLQRALAGFCLVRRVRTVELAARCDIPDGCRNVVLVGTGTDKAQTAHRRIAARSNCIRRVQSRHFRSARGRQYASRQRFDTAARFGNFVEQVVDTLAAPMASSISSCVFLGMRYERHGYTSACSGGRASLPVEQMTLIASSGDIKHRLVGIVARLQA